MGTLNDILTVKLYVQAAATGGSTRTALVHVFVDEPYNRTGFTLASHCSTSVSGMEKRCRDMCCAMPCAAVCEMEMQCRFECIE